jgi:flagellar protein FlaG
MSTDITNNQIAKDVRSASASTTASVSSGRQNVAALAGNSLPPVSTGSQDVSSEQIQEVVAKLNEHAQSINRDLQFSVDDASGRTVIRVVNSETEELVRQIPSEEVLRISRNLQENIENNSGLIFQTSA